MLCSSMAPVFVHLDFLSCVEATQNHLTAAHGTSQSLLHDHFEASKPELQPELIILWIEF